MDKRVIIALMLILLIVPSLSGCTEKDNDGDGENGAESFLMSSSGGWIKPIDKPVSLHFLPGSITEEMDIAISTATDLPPDEGVLSELAYEFGPDGTFFDQPIEMIMDYSDVELPEGIEEYMLRLAKITEDGYDIIQGSEVDIDEKTVSGSVSSFSGYCVVGRHYGMMISSNKDRIAANGLDEATITVVVKKLKSTDKGEATGDPAAETTVSFEIMDEKGRKNYQSEKTTSTGAVWLKITGDKPGRFIIRAKATYEKIQGFAYVYVGGDWPYFEDFEDDLGDEWTYSDIVMVKNERTYERERTPSIEYSPNNMAIFLGKFTTNLVMLKLENIPPHYWIIVEFDLIAIGPWKYGVDEVWSDAFNDPDSTWGHCSSNDVDLQDDPLKSEVSNSLGYDTTPLVYKDGNEDITLETGDRIIPVRGIIRNHFSDFIEWGITVDERGFGQDSDVGQYWGIDNIYVRYIGGY